MGTAEAAACWWRLQFNCRIADQEQRGGSEKTYLLMVSLGDSFYVGRRFRNGPKFACYRGVLLLVIWGCICPPTEQLSAGSAELQSRWTPTIVQDEAFVVAVAVEPVMIRAIRGCRGCMQLPTQTTIARRRRLCVYHAALSPNDA